NRHSFLFGNHNGELWAMATDTEDKSAAPSGDAITAAASTIETKAIEPVAAPAPAALKADQLPIIEAPKLAAATPKLAEAPKSEPPKAEPLRAEPPKVIELNAAAETSAPLAAEPSAPVAPIALARVHRYAPLAASIAIGVLCGALGASALLWSSEPTE